MGVYQMKFAKIMIIIVIFVFAMSVSCAADTNNASISEDNSQMLLSLKNEITDDTSENSILAQTNNDETLSAQKDSEILRANEGTYEDLRNDINNGGSLTKSYYRYQPGDGDTIKINSGGFTVNGNGAVIDMEGSNIRAFEVTRSGVTFKNLTIKNANFNGNGGAIYFSSSGTVENCNFTGNTATGSTSRGGAVYFGGTGDVRNCNFTANTATGNGGAVYIDGEGTVSNCNFTGNTATGDGGAINMGSGTVSNCNFTGNNATNNGGAVYFAGSGTVSNCNFTGNNAPYGMGGAVYIGRTGDVRNCNFTANTATKEGGAVYIGRTGDVRNCNFAGNTANYGGAINMGSGTVLNCNFTDNNATRWGGAVYIGGSGTVSNCNFTGNNATSYGGAIYFSSSGTTHEVRNCNFTGNTATNNGGAVYFTGTGDVRNCNFTGNTATTYAGGAVYIGGTGDVRNCNFAGNNATDDGGAVYFWNTGNVTNCNFTDNTATTGSAIYFYSTSAQKSVSNSTFLNNRANAKDLQVTKNENNITIIFTGNNNILNAIYSRNDAEVSFSNVTYWGASGIVNTDTYKPSISNNAAGQNITVSIVINDKIDSNEVYVTDENGTIVLNRNVGDNYFIRVCHDTDSYYTEILNSTSKNTQFSVSVNNQTTNNRKVNITAKSNIPNEVLKGKLLFILPNSTQINANYTSNGTWWAVHEFDDAGDYDINASYIGLDGVIINNATISIRYDASVDVNNKTLDLFVEDTFNLNATTNPRNLPVNFTSSNPSVVTVDKNGKVVALSEGNATIIVSVGGDGKYAENSTTVNVTVNKVPTSISIENETINLEVNDEMGTGATLHPTDAGNLTYNLSNGGIVKIENGNIIALKEGNVTITVSFKGNNKYLAAQNKTINVTVTLKDASVTVNNDTLNLGIDQKFNIKATTTPEGLNVTYGQDDSGVYLVDKNGVVTALKIGQGTVYVRIGGDGVYAEKYTLVFVNVTKVSTEIKVTNTTLDLKVNGEAETGATLTPTNAGNLTYTSSNPSVAIVEDDIIKALAEGSAVITASFAGNDKYAAAENKTITVNVSLNDASVSVNNDTLDLLVDDKFNLIATTQPKNLTVNFTSSNTSVVTIDNKGNVVAVSEGNAIITLSVGGDGVYAENSTDVKVSVSKVSTEIKINSPTGEMSVGAMGHVSAELIPSEAGKLSYVSNDTSIATVSSTGVIKANKEGTALITVSFAGNDKYAAAENKTIKLTVKKVNTLMDVSADDITEGENATIRVSLPSDATGNVTTTVNGKNYSSKVKDGNATIIIPDLEYGNYTIPVSYSGDGKYNPSTDDVDFTVKEDEIVVSAPDLTKYYSGPEPFIVNVTYARGVPVEDKELEITINGVTYTKTTDEDGIASLSINLNSKTYDVTTVVDNITVNSLVIILPTIEAEDVESKSKNIIFTATFLDSEGNYLTDGTNVSFNIGGVIYNAQVSGDKGLASVDLILDTGRYLITSQNPVTYENAVNSIAVDLKDADMILSDDEISVGENATISVTLPSDAAGNVTAKINGKTYTSKVKDGKATITIPDLSTGNYTVQVTYSGDYNYNSASGNTSIKVNKVNAAMSVDAPAITVGENATVTVNLPEDAAGNVTIGNETVSVKDGAASAVLTDLPVGTNTVPVTYSGDDKYNPIETSADIIVNDKPVPTKKNLTIEASADEITEGEDVVIVVSGLENATGNVSAVVHGHIHSAPIVDGTANITISGLTDNALASVSYAGDDIYNPAVTAVNITVNKNTVTINAQNLTKYYKDPQKFTVTVTDAKGQAAANKTVEITINGVTYTRTTDENGTASLNINLNSGEYPVSVAVDDVVVNSTVTVKATIDASDIVKVFGNDTQYYATFTDVNGTPVANTTVSFNVNGVIYNRTTDENGTAKLNINLPPGEYILTATNTETGEKISNVIKVLSFIESADLTKYFRNESQFVVRIHTADGGYVGAGEEVKFNINGKIYTRTTNATGHAKLNINLGQGNYTITTYYKEYTQGNNIEVLPILSADDLVMKFMDGSQFKAKLVDGKGNPYTNKNVTFNVNGIFYNRLTDSEGIAKLNIRLPAGEYIITSSYNGCNIANKITIRG